MRFEISRSSGKNPPCQGASLAVVDEWDNKWYTIEVGSLNELLTLVREHGSIIVAEGYTPRGDGEASFSMTLEIYDDYRE